MTFEEILSRFDVDKRRGDSAQCHCPAHADREASLTISRGIKGTVVCCHAKCSTESILSAVGLKMRDLFDIRPGDKLLLLGDAAQGIAIPPKDRFDGLFKTVFGEGWNNG